MWETRRVRSEQRWRRGHGGKWLGKYLARLCTYGNTRSSVAPSTTTNRIAPFHSQTAVVIDDAFISEWHPKYDWTESDEGEYQELVAIVSRDIASAGTVSKSTFLRIWNWKGAMREIGHVLIDAYDTLYAPAFRRVASEPPERKLAAL
jgi:hypothetical protein